MPSPPPQIGEGHADRQIYLSLVGSVNEALKPITHRYVFNNFLHIGFGRLEG